MDADSAALIERLAANAWPAATVQHVDGWLLRHTPAVARRRSNSALPPPPAARVPADRLRTRCPAVSVADAVSPRWLAAWTAIEGRADAAATGQLVLARIAPQAGFLTAAHGTQVLGVAMLVVERGWAGVFCMATRPGADHGARRL